MVAIKKKNNSNDYYTDPDQPGYQKRPLDVRDFLLPKMEEQIRKICMATETARHQINSGVPAERVLANLRSVAEDCDECQTILAKAIDEN